MLRSLLVLSLIFSACGGSSTNSGEPDVISQPDVPLSRDIDKTPLVFGDPMPVEWQHTYGAYDDNSSSRDREAIVGLASAPDGTLFALSDRRYGDDPYGDDLVLLQLDAAGTLTDKKLLRFGNGVAPLGFARAPDGTLLLAADLSDLTIATITPAGEPGWSRAFDREPYAFGGLGLSQLALDAAGNIYIVGAFNPSDLDSGDRGYVAKLDPTGQPLWMRSWPHATFFDDLRLAVSTGTIYVTDRVESSDFSDQVVLAFSASGETVGQHMLTYESFDGPRAAVNNGAFIADGSGAVLVGVRATAVDENFNVFVYRAEFDDKLALVGSSATKLPTGPGPIASSVRLVRSGASSFRAITRILRDSNYTVLAFEDGDPVAAAFDIIRADTTSPFLEDDDFPILAAPGPSGALYIAATTDVPGQVSLRSRTAVAIDLPLDLSDPKLVITTDQLVTQDGDTFTVATEEAGVLDDAQADDEDALLIKTTLP